ncbi:MAG: HAD family hydrolase [Gammaproteobacteria bacterium]|nr:HAD hydrolase family protein [Pseudomonadales bacterium]MCP5347484.1 HAD hydrolase family protein [Pseudomonadales bacterium]
MTLYVSDLDGTLLNSNAELSKFSKDLLNELLSDGMTFTVASARSISSIRQMLEGLALSLPVIEFNGAFISDLQSGRHEFINAIDSALAPELYQVMSARGCGPFVSTYNGIEDCLYHPEPHNGGSHWYYQDRKSRSDPRLRRLEDPGISLNEQVVCLTSIARKEELMDLACHLADEFGSQVEIHLIENHYSPGWHWLTVHDRKATKDQAIHSLRDSLGLSSNELVVFGDQLNDLKMFSIADLSIAVDNAVTELKEAATSIIGRNDHDSVARFIAEHRQLSAALGK